MEIIKENKRRIISLVLAILILITSIPIPVIAEEIQKDNVSEEIVEGTGTDTESKTEDTEEEQIIEESEIDLSSEEAQSEEGKFKVALRWGGTSDTAYTWDATKSENRVIKLTFYYQNEVTPVAYAPGDLVVTIPGIGKLNRDSTIKATDIAADVYGAAELKRDWSYKYDASTDTYTFYNNHEIEQGETFNGSFEMLWEFTSRNCINAYEQTLKATLTAGEETIESQELSLNFTSVRDTFYINKTAKSLVSGDGLSKYVEEGKTVSDYAWVQYTFRYNVKELNARALKSRYLIDTLPKGCVIARDTNVIKNEDGTVSYCVPEMPVSENYVRESSIIVGYPEEYIGQTIENTAYIYGTYKDEEEDVLLADSTVEVILDRIQGQAVGIVPGKYVSPDWIYRSSLEGDINFSASLHATATTNSENEGYTVTITDDLLEIYTPANTESGKEAAYHTLTDDEYKFTQITVPGVSNFTNANGYKLSEGDYTVKIYALYKKDVNTRGLDEYTLIHEGKWDNNNITKTLEEDAVAIRAEVSGLKESIRSFYISVRGIINVSENVANNIYENPSYIVNYQFTELKDKNGNSLIGNIGKENYSQERLYERDSTIYGKGLLRAQDTITIREKTVDPGYYYARSDIEAFSVDENVENFITKLNYYTDVNNTNSKEIKKVEVHGVVQKEELETLLETLEITHNGLTFKNALSSDTDMKDYLMERATITKNGTEISVVFDFSDNPIVSTNFNLGFTVDATLNYEKYYEATDPSYSIRTYAYLEDSGLQPQSTATHNSKTMATASDSENILLALASHQQLIKMVKTEYTEDFVQENAVAPMDTEYTYRLKLRNGYNTLVNTEIIDILEHSELTVVDGENPYSESEWYGTFKSVDVTQIENQNLGTNVYYANTLTPDESSWVLMESYADGIWTTANEVLAIKIEIDGEITENSIIYADVNMLAPNDIDLEDKKAYNSYMINSDAIDLYTGVQSTYMEKMPSNNVDVRLVQKEYNVDIIKTDATSGSKLSGVIFGIYDEEDKLKGLSMTGLLGNATIKGLKEGIYKIKEELVPLGYEKAFDYLELTIKDGKYAIKEVYTEYEDRHYDLTFTSTGDYTWTQNEDGTWQSNNYNVHSTTTTMDSNEFTVEKDGIISFDWSVSSQSSSYDYAYYTITNVNTGTNIGGTSTKISGTGLGTVYDSLKFNSVQKELEAGTYKISFAYRKNGSTNSGLDRAFVKNVQVDTQVAVEKEKIAEEQEIALEGQIPTISLNIENQRAKGSITVYKKDEYLNSSKKEIPLLGAQFELLDTDGNVIAEGTTDSAGKIIFEELDWGQTYIIKEKQSPTGYEFIETDVNTYLSKLNKDKTVTIENTRKTGTAILTKQDEKDGTKLEGAVYGLYAKNNIYHKEGNIIYEPDTLIEEQITNAEGQVIFENLIWGNYYIQEIETVYGYELSEEKYEFTISTQTVEETILKTEYEERSLANLQLIKIDEKGSFLPGVEFGLYTEEGKEVIIRDAETSEQIAHITDINGQLNIQGIEWGNYYIQELKAPEGYEVSTIKYMFTVDRETFANGNNTVTIVKNEETGEEVSVIRNNRKKGKASLTKYACDAEGNETETVLANAIYELYSSDGTLIGEYTTDENGKIAVENLKWDSYYFLEKQAPEGYSISDKKISFVINSKNADFEQELTAYNKQESGEIKINKTISAESIYEAHGDSTFIFKIVGKDESGEEKVTLYRTITFTEQDISNVDQDGNITKTVTISDIEPYNYEITEEKNYRYELSTITPVTNAEINGETGLINLIQATENKGEISFTNEKTSNSLLTDNGLITNTAQNEYYLIGIEVKPKEESYEIGTTLTASDFTYTLYYSGGQEQEVESDVLESVTFGGETTYAEELAGNHIINIETIYNGKKYETQVAMKWVMPSDYFTYTVIDSTAKTIAITGINSTYTSPELLYIPSEYNGYKVVQVAGTGTNSSNKLSNIGNVKTVEIEDGIEVIGYDAFYNCINIQKVKLPDSVTSIRNGAFRGCSKLESIDLSNTRITIIGNSAFSNCNSLTSIDIPDSVTSIGNDVFSNCSKLENIDLSNTQITSIGISAFYNCKSLISIDLPESVTSIALYAFYNCNSLTSIKLPDSVTSIGNSAFSNCNSLTSIKLPDSLTSIGESAFYGCNKLGSIDFSNTQTTNIGTYAFYGCSSLTSVEVSERLASIGEYAFANCNSLTSIDLSNTEITNIEDNMFRYYQSSLVNIKLPDKVTNVEGFYSYNYIYLESIEISENNEYYSTIDGVLYNKDKTQLIRYPAKKTDLSEYIVPETVIGIGNAFMYSKLVSIDLSNTQITTLDSNVFQECTNLTSVILPDTITSIGNQAFYNCQKLITIDLSNTQVTSIGDFAFHGCSILTSIGNIPESVTTIGNNAFRECKKLENIDLSNTQITSIGNYAFYKCNSLTSVGDIPDSLTSIGNYAFRECKKLENIDLSNTQITSIGNMAFYGCSSLTSIEIPDTVTSIGNSVFRGCSSLTSINVSNDNEHYLSIDGILYNKDKTQLICYPSGKTDLTEYIVPDIVTSIGATAFYGCSGLTSIDLSNTQITSIGTEMFYNCSNLTSVKLPDCVTSIGDYAFYGCSSLTSIDLSNTQITSVGTQMFYNCSNLTSVKLPESVTSIGANAFYNCSITSIELPESITTIGILAFRNCKSLTSIEIPSGVTNIGQQLFEGCSSLTSIDLPATVTSIGSNAFKNCSNLTTINYYGTEEQFAAITVNSTGNSYFTNATVNYITE